MKVRKMLVTIAWTVLAVVAASESAPATTTITYSYDAQHRLVQADYSASRKVQYSYDAAGNLDMEVAITDAQYFRSFLLFLAQRAAQEGTDLVVQALRHTVAAMWQERGIASS